MLTIFCNFYTVVWKNLGVKNSRKAFSEKLVDVTPGVTFNHIFSLFSLFSVEMCILQGCF